MNKQLAKTRIQKSIWSIMLLVIINIFVQGCTGVSSPTVSTQGAPSNTGQGISLNESVLTQHNDNARTGAYLAEKWLKPSNVTASSFGRLFSLHVDGQVIAQPLYVSGLSINGVQKNVLYVATRTNKIYAFDADAKPPAPSAEVSPLWSTKAFTDPKYINDKIPDYIDTQGHYHPMGNPDYGKPLQAAPLPGMDDGPHPCLQTHGPVGITSTPVIDPATFTMYIVYRTGLPPDPNLDHHNSSYMSEAHYWLAALDIHDGSLRRSPVEIKFPDFDPNEELNRPGLLLLNGKLYIGFGAAVCDSGGNPWIPVEQKPSKPHGWIFAYQTQPQLGILDAFNTTPKTFGGGVWQSGNGLTGDSQGNVYALTGNNFDSPDPERAEAILKLHLGPDNKFCNDCVQYFTAGNWYRLNTGQHYPREPKSDLMNYDGQPVPDPNNPKMNLQVGGDSDLGSGGAVLLANGTIIGGGKQGRLYVLDPAHMKRGPNQAKQAFQAFYNSWTPEISPCNYDQDQSYGPNIHGGLVTWHPAGQPYSLVYGMPEKDYLKAFKAYDDGHIDEHPAMTTMDINVRSPIGMPGGFLSLSANRDHDGIIWASVVNQDGGDAINTQGDFQGRLIAFDALTLKELWQDPQEEPFMKYVPPTIAGGRIFRVTYNGAKMKTGDKIVEDGIIVYGLTGQPPTKTLDSPVVSKGPVTALWRDPNHLDLFMTSNNGTVMSSSWEGNCGGQNTTTAIIPNWREWFPISAPGFAAPRQPVTAVWSNSKHDHLDIFVASHDGTVMSTFWETNKKIPSANGLWLRDPRSSTHIAWFQVGAAHITIAGQPITALWRDPDRHLDLFITGQDGSVLSTYWEPQPDQQGQTWRNWFSLRADQGGKAAPGQLITALWSNSVHNHLDVFVTDKDGSVKSIYWDNVTNQWQPAWFPIGAAHITVPGQPITALWRDPDQLHSHQQHLDLFMTGQDGSVLSTYWEPQPDQQGQTWRNWFLPSTDSSGLVAPGQPISALWSNTSYNHLDVFMTDKDGMVRSIYWDNVTNKWQPAWFQIGAANIGVPGQPITALWRDPDQHLDLFMTGQDGSVLSTYWELQPDQQGQTWRDWFVI